MEVSVSEIENFFKPARTIIERRQSMNISNKPEDLSVIRQLALKNAELQAANKELKEENEKVKTLCGFVWVDGCGCENHVIERMYQQNKKLQTENKNLKNEIARLESMDTNGRRKATMARKVKDD